MTTTTTVNTIRTITVTLKINVILRSNYFSFVISLFYFIPENILVNDHPLSEAASFSSPWFSLFGVVRFLLGKGFCSFLSITETTVLYLLGQPLNNYQFVRNLMKRNFTVVFLKNIWNAQRNYFRIQHRAIYWACFYFHSFKLLRKLYIPTVWLISSSNFMYKNNNTNVSKTR